MNSYTVSRPTPTPINRANGIGFVYYIGNEFEDGSVRDVSEFGEGLSQRQIRVDGVWLNMIFLLGEDQQYLFDPDLNRIWSTEPAT